MSLRPGAVNFEEKWPELQETIRSVVQLHSVKMTTWNDHYSDIYALCEAFPIAYDDRLYEETQRLLEAFVSSLREQLLQQRGSQSAILSAYQKHWLKYSKGAAFLDNLFSYFNRVSLRKHQPQDTYDSGMAGLGIPELTAPPEDCPVEIRNMALRAWREKMVESVREPLVRALLHEVRRDREGQEARLTRVRDVVFSLIEVESYSKLSPLKYYQEVFEAPFLSETGEYYQQVASKIVTEASVSEYMEQAVSQLQSARRRGEMFLHQTSVTKFFRECEAKLVEEKSDYLYEHVPTMIHEERRKDLSNLFVLLNGIPRALEPVVEQFENHVQSEGLNALSRLRLDKNPNVSEFVSTVLGVHRKFLQMVAEVFNSHKMFCSALDRACRGFVNMTERPKQHPKAPMLLAHYCDQLLRKSSKGLGEQEVEDRLEEAITVFKYVVDKDLFQKFYTRMLSRRLVHSLSLSMEAEESMIQKMKHACGYEYTSRLQRMLVDMKLSADCMAEFQDQLTSCSSSLPISFSTLVLQFAAWPLSRMQCGFSVPQELTVATEKFETFYSQKHSGRKLTWLHHMSFGELKMTYLKRPYTVCVTTFQMAVLLAFNQSDLHTFHSLLQYTQLGEMELMQTVQSLVDCKLLSLQGGEAVGGDSVLKLNKSYSNKRAKFKVTASLQRESQQDIDQTQFSVQEDRKLHIQAAIVRVMKARKVLKHNQLIEETISQVRSRFTPNVQMIKRCIETLIDKEYLERLVGSRNSYSYIA